MGGLFKACELRAARRASFGLPSCMQSLSALQSLVSSQSSAQGLTAPGSRSTAAFAQSRSTACRWCCWSWGSSTPSIETTEISTLMALTKTIRRTALGGWFQIQPDPCTASAHTCRPVPPPRHTTAPPPFDGCSGGLLGLAGAAAVPAKSQRWGRRWQWGRLQRYMYCQVKGASKQAAAGFYSYPS